jgi:hypothetical protein
MAILLTLAGALAGFACISLNGYTNKEFPSGRYRTPVHNTGLTFDPESVPSSFSRGFKARRFISLRKGQESLAVVALILLSLTWPIS